MTDRPEDMKRLVDYMLGSWPRASTIDSERVGFFGFSRRGFTGLVLAGGNPDFDLLLEHCPAYRGNRFCEQIRNKSLSVQPMVHDPRIKAAVLADPALGSLFTRAGLKTVTVPIQLWASERGGDGVSPGDAAGVAGNLPSIADYRVVPNAGHFAFLPPCSPELTKTALARGEAEICTDAAPFDRVAFHQQFDTDVLAFFRKQLIDAPKP